VRLNETKVRARTAGGLLPRCSEMKAQVAECLGPERSDQHDDLEAEQVSISKGNSIFDELDAHQSG